MLIYGANKAAIGYLNKKDIQPLYICYQLLYTVLAQRPSSQPYPVGQAEQAAPVWYITEFRKFPALA